MASSAVVTAVEARLAANWASTAIVGLNGQGGAAEPPEDGAPYVVVQYPLASEAQMSLGDPGNNLWREEGTFRLVLHARRGEGRAQALTWMDELRAIFRGQVFAGIDCREASPPIENDQNDQGNYYVFSSSVAYRFDING